MLDGGLRLQVALRGYKAEPEAILLPSAGNRTTGRGEKAGGWADGAGGRGLAQGTSRAGGEHQAWAWTGREGPLCPLPPQPPAHCGAVSFVCQLVAYLVLGPS